MRNTIFFLFIVSCLLAACEKDIKVPIPPHQPKLVLNGLIRENSVFELSVSKSQGILTATPTNDPQSIYRVSNARVLLFENNIPAGELSYNAGTRRYRSLTNKRVTLGRQYRIVAVAPGIKDTAEVLNTVPTRPVITRLTRVANARTNSSGEPLDEITLTFNDPAGEKNYYLVRLQYSPGGNNIYQLVPCIYTNDADVEKDDTDDPFGPEACLNEGRALLRDDNFNGRTKQLKISVSSFYIPASPGPLPRTIIELWHITEAHFRYLKSRNTYSNTEDNPFAEPALVFSNVKNGYGVFSTYTAAVDSIR
jgi:hypothetical protein